MPFVSSLTKSFSRAQPQAVGKRFLISNRSYTRCSTLLSLRPAVPHSSPSVLKNLRRPDMSDALRSEKNQAFASTPEQIEESVDVATLHWCKTVTSGAEDNWKRVSDLYAQDALLWGTVSEDLRGTQDLVDYFKYFAMIPGLSLKPGSYKSQVQVMGDSAINSGYYTFQMPNADGSIKEVPARFTFVYRKRAEAMDGIEWEIVNHHSSAIPAQPESLSPILAKQ